MNPSALRKQIEENRRSVAFDSYDITVRQLFDMVSDGVIDIAPDYQRHFVWDKTRQSQLIESILLGIPVPSLFMATNSDSTWEVIDGLQRISTIINFVAPEKIGKEVSEYYIPLRIEGLEKLTQLNNCSFDDLPQSIQLMLMTRPIRITVLNDRSDFTVRYDLFERLNTGGIVLHPQEIRNCIFIGKFSEFLKRCASKDSFRACVRLSESKEKNGNMEELVLKFFAYFEDREIFDHSVKGFLNDYMKRKHEEFTDSERKKLQERFDKTFDAISAALPNGIVRGDRAKVTPLVLYEAIAVGVADIIEAGGQVDNVKLLSMLNNDELRRFTTGATNSNKMLINRISYVSENARA